MLMMPKAASGSVTALVTRRPVRATTRMSPPSPSAATRSRDAPAGWTLEDQADHVAAFVKERTRGPVHVVGHSVGGAVAAPLTWCGWA